MFIRTGALIVLMIFLAAGTAGPLGLARAAQPEPEFQEEIDSQPSDNMENEMAKRVIGEPVLNDDDITRELAAQEVFADMLAQAQVNFVEDGPFTIRHGQNNGRETYFVLVSKILDGQDIVRVYEYRLKDGKAAAFGCRSVAAEDFAAYAEEHGLDPLPEFK